MTVTDPITLLIVSFLVLFALMAIGVPIAISLAIVGAIGFFVFQGDASLVSLLPFRTLDSFILTAIPLFIFMGEILVKCGASELIYRGASRLLSWLPGGLWHANIGACAMFAAISGSSPATAATIGTVAIPSLKTRGYDTRITLGSLAAGGTLGILIPPSINMIVYGVIAEQSIGRLFAGGVIPGVMLAGMFMLSIIIRVLMDKKLAPREAAFSLKNVGLSFLDLWPLYVLAVIVLGGIFGGYMTPTEAAAVGACASLILAIILRRFNWGILKASLASSVETTCMVLFIVVGSSIMASFFSRAGIPQAVTGMIIGAGVSKWAVLTYICLIYLFLGCFIDPVSMLLLTAATVIPLIKQMGFDLIWFGVIYVVLAEIGMITPPMGLNLFVIQGISREDLGKVVIGSIPFFFLMLIAIALLTLFPSLILWFPNLLFGTQ
ncbi:MAG: TRAP transporter large permease [Chloroflexi bacterium]|nr:TRAP transporter large permease [Chloroflexota bacterium]